MKPEELYAQDLLEFTGKSLMEYQKIQDKFVEIDPETHSTRLEEQAFSCVDCYNPTYQQLLNAYNNAVLNAFIYANRLSKDFHSSEEINYEYKWVQIARDHNAMKKKKALDYGCGAMDNSYILKKLNYDVTVVELPVDWYLFLQYRHKKHNKKDKQPFKFIEASNWLNFFDKKDEFDFIIATEVFEHVLSPYDTLMYLASVLKETGLIYITVSFTNNLFHLENNYKRFGVESDGVECSDGNQAWQDALKLAHLELYWQDNSKHNCIYKKREDNDYGIKQKGKNNSGD